MTWGAAGWSPLVEPRHDGARAAAGACRGDAARVGGRAGGGSVLTRLSPQVQPRTVAIPDDLQLSFENLLSHK